jgi:hypothetical protein
MQRAGIGPAQREPVEAEMRKQQEAEAKGRAVTYSDEELRDLIVKAIVEGGYRNAGAWNKARRAEGQGSNDARVRRAWSAALSKSAKARQLVEEHEAEVKAERAEAFARARAPKATKAGAATKATSTRKATSRKAGSSRKATAKEGDQTAADVVKATNAGERVRARRTRKAA